MKKTFADHIKDYLTPSLLIGAIIYGAYYGGDFLKGEEAYKEALKEVTFDNSKQKNDHIDHVNTKYNPVNVYKQADTLKRQQNGIKLLMENQNSIMDSIYRQNNKRDSINIIEEAKKNRSRDAREDKMNIIIEGLENINKRFDSIKQ